MGQIHYFDDVEVTLSGEVNSRNTSPLIAEYNYFHNNWKTTAAIHWDSETNETERALLKFQRKGKNNSLFNFAYRFRKGKIEQLDSSVVLPFKQKYRFIARWNYSMDSNSTIEALAGLEYKSCCWASRLVARRHVYNELGDSKSGIYFELQLNGLGSLGRNPRRLLKQSISGYSEEHFWTSNTPSKIKARITRKKRIRLVPMCKRGDPTRIHASLLPQRLVSRRISHAIMGGFEK